MRQVASVKAVLERRVGLFRTVVHTDHGMPEEVVNNFRDLGVGWCEEHVHGARKLIEKYKIPLPDKVEQHNLEEAERNLDWKPAIGFLDFIRDLKARDERGIDVTGLWVPSELPSNFGR